MSQAEFGVNSEDSRDPFPPSGDEGSMSSDAFQSINNAENSNTTSAVLQVGTPTTLLASSRNSSRTSFEIAAGDAFREITASNLHEYFWPRNSVADRYFIQEQLAVFLDVKSFKRKYPDLSRRPITEFEERSYLLQNDIVTQTQLNMGLTALRAEDVYDLMTNDYLEKFEEYKKVIAERNKQAMAVKQMELQAIKSDSKRLEEWRRKAIRSATEWNAELNRDRSRERQYYFDMETMVIQEPDRKRNRIYPANFGAYPTALVPGQHHHFYKKYTKDELYQLPVNGVTQVDEYLPIKRSRSPGPITVKPEELLQADIEENKRKKEAEEKSHSTKSKTLISERLSAEERAEETGENCAFCQEDIYHGDRFVQCSKCGSCGHPLCMDMTDEMYDVVKTYNWMCMECKPCSICSKLDEEDKMLFCDRCDRGYHTFCVGLAELPSGRWVCPKFCVGIVQRAKAAQAATLKAAEGAVAFVVATPSTLKPSMTMEETVEAVAQAVLSGDAQSISSISCLKSVGSLSNSPRSTPEPQQQQATKRRNSASVNVGNMCIRCGGATGKGRRKIAVCNKCLAAEEAMKKESIDEEDKETL